MDPICTEDRKNYFFDVVAFTVSTYGEQIMHDNEGGGIIEGKVCRKGVLLSRGDVKG